MESMRGTHHAEATHLNVRVMSDDSDNENTELSNRIKQRNEAKAAYRAEVKQGKKDFENSLVAKAIRMVHNHPCATAVLGLGVAITAGGAFLTMDAFNRERSTTAYANPNGQPAQIPANPYATATTQMRDAFTGNTTASYDGTTAYHNGTTAFHNGTTASYNATNAPFNSSSVDLGIDTTVVPTQHFTGVPNHTTQVQLGVNATVVPPQNVTMGVNPVNVNATNPATPAQQTEYKPCFSDEHKHARHARSTGEHRWDDGIPRYVVSGKGGGWTVSGSSQDKSITFSNQQVCAKENDANVYELNLRDRTYEVNDVGFCTESGKFEKSGELDNFKTDCGISFVHTSTDGVQSSLCATTKGDESMFNALVEEGVRNVIHETGSKEQGWSLFHKFKAMANAYEKAGFVDTARIIKATAENVLDVQEDSVPNFILSSTRSAIAMNHDDDVKEVYKCSIKDSGNSDNYKDSVNYQKNVGTKYSIVAEKQRGSTVRTVPYYGKIATTSQKDVTDHTIRAQLVENPKNCNATQIYRISRNGASLENHLDRPLKEENPAGSLGNCIFTNISPMKSKDTNTRYTCVSKDERYFFKLTKEIVKEQLGTLGDAPDHIELEKAMIELNKMANAYEASVEGYKLGIGLAIKKAAAEVICEIDESYRYIADCTLLNVDDVNPLEDPTTIRPTTTKPTTTVSEGGEDGIAHTTQQANIGHDTTTAGFGVANSTAQATSTNPSVNGTTLGVNGTANSTGVEDLWVANTTVTTNLPSSATYVPKPSWSTTGGSDVVKPVVPENKWRFTPNDQKLIGGSMMGLGGFMSLAAIGKILWGDDKDERSYDLDNARKNSMKKAYQAAAQEDNGYEGGDEEQVVAQV